MTASSASRSVSPVNSPAAEPRTRAGLAGSIWGVRDQRAGRGLAAKEISLECAPATKPDFAVDAQQVV